VNRNRRAIRCGLIGYGAWGCHHARALKETARAELVAICSRSEESRATAKSDHPGARIWPDYWDLLSKEDVDAVAVVLPSDLHYEVARAVLGSGRHLLLEKPMALSVAHCDELVALAKARSRLLAIGHELRMSSLWGRVEKLVVEGAIGEPLDGLIELWRNPYRLGSGGWRYDINRVGNWILEEPIHFFDLARWYFADAGNPVSVDAAANGRRPDHPELHDNFTAIVRFPRGRYAVISQTLAGWEHHQVVKLTGTDGALWASWSGALDRTFEPTFQLRLLRGGAPMEVPLAKPSGEVYELVDQAAAFISAVRDGTPLPCSGDNGRWSAVMCLEAARSLELGRPVPLSES
jgi:myo-inositol 2-dehydrogenase/D-chiro-inositol 1-dehydrogenase